MVFLGAGASSSGHTYPARGAPPHFCLLPVNLNHKKLYLGAPFVFPGAPSPIFVARVAEGPNNPSYWIDQNRRLIPVDGIFPRQDYDSDHWVEEPWSSRIVTVNGFHPAVTVMSPGDRNFHTIFETPFFDDNGYQWLSGPMILSRSHQTIVLKPGGRPYVVGANGISPWLPGSILAQHGVWGITNVYDSRSLLATVIIGVDGNIYLLTDDGSWQDLGNFDSYHFSIGMGLNRTAEFYDLPALGTLIVAFVKSGTVSNHTIIAIHRNQIGARNRFSVQVLQSSGWFERDSVYVFSGTFSQLLRLGAGSDLLPHSSFPRWQIYTGAGFQDIPGGKSKFALPLADPVGFSQTTLRPLTSIGRDLIAGDKEFFLYDGVSIIPVAGSTPDRLGAFPAVVDLPAIGHVLITSEAGIFDLKPDGRLIRLKMPFGVSAPYKVTLANWAEAGVALAETSGGLYEIDKNLKATLIPGGEAFENTSLVQMSLGDILPAREKVVANARALYVVVDTALSGPNACQIN